MLKGLRERVRQALGMGPKQRARLYHVRSADEVAGLAALLHVPAGLTAGHVAEEIEALRALPQSSLYLQIQHPGKEPFEVQFLPGHDGRLSLRLTVDAKRLEWGYTFPDDLPSGERGEDAAPPPPPAAPPAPQPEVIALCVTNGHEPKYTVKVPPTIAHASLVARGRVVASAIPLAGATEAVKVRVT
jgi:hypothetical protein